MNRVRNEQDGTLEWVVSGDEGAVNFLVFPEKGKEWERACVIGFHGKDRLPLGGDRRVRCDLLPGGKCWQDQDWARAAQLWRDSRQGTRDVVIWTELARRYEDRFGELR